MNVLRKKIPPPSSLGAPAALDQVCLRALSRTPGGRYASAEEMAQDLLQAAGGAHLVANPHQVGRWVQQSVGDVLAERRRRVQAATSVAPTPVRKSRGGDTMVMETVAPRTKTPMQCRPAAASPGRWRRSPVRSRATLPSGEIPEWPAQSSRVQLVLVAALAAAVRGGAGRGRNVHLLQSTQLPGRLGAPLSSPEACLKSA